MPSAANNQGEATVLTESLATVLLVVKVASVEANEETEVASVEAAEAWVEVHVSKKSKGW